MANRYRLPARVLHWGIAAMLVAIIPLGVRMVHAPPAQEAAKLRLYDWHENLGVTLWLLVWARLLWRRLSPPPPWPAGTPRFVLIGARANHVAIYGLLLVQPVLGFLATNAWGFPRIWWGLVRLPSPVGHDETIAPILSRLHNATGFLLILLILAHLAGATYHGLVRRDGMLRRMV